MTRKPDPTVPKPSRADVQTDGGVIYAETDTDEDEPAAVDAPLPVDVRQCGGHRVERKPDRHARPEGRRGDPGLRQAPAQSARRLPDDERDRRRALCRQGAQPEEAGDELRARPRPFQPHHKDDRPDGEHGIRHHAHRDRGAAARGQSDQAPQAALQRADARRQVVPLYPDHRRPRGAGHLQASRRALAQGRLFRPLRLRRRGRPHHQCAAARLPAQDLHRQRLREPDAAPPMPALPDQALFRPLHRRDRRRGLRAAWSAKPRISSPGAVRR